MNIYKIINISTPLAPEKSTDHALIVAMRLNDIGKVRPCCEVRLVIPRKTMIFEFSQRLASNLELKSVISENNISERLVLKAISTIKKFARIKQYRGKDYHQHPYPLLGRSEAYSTDISALAIATSITLQLINEILEKLLTLDFVSNSRSIFLIVTFIELFTNDLITRPALCFGADTDIETRRSVMNSVFVKGVLKKSGSLVIQMVEKAEMTLNQELILIANQHLNMIRPYRFQGEQK